MGSENRNIWTEGKGCSVPLVMTCKGAEELNARGCNPRYAGTKDERRNAITDEKDRMLANSKTMKGSNQWKNMTCLALNTIITKLFNCIKVLPYLLNDTSENYLIKIGYSEKIRDLWISAEGWCCFFTESSRHSRGLLGSSLQQVATVDAWVMYKRTTVLSELSTRICLCHIIFLEMEVCSIGRT